MEHQHSKNIASNFDQLLYKTKFNIFWLFSFLTILCYSLGITFPSLRYLKYGLPLIAIMLVISKNTLSTPSKLSEKYLRFYIIFYCTICIFSLLVILAKTGIYTRYFQEFYFILAPIILAYIISFFYSEHNNIKKIKYLFWLMVLGYMAQKGNHIFSVIMNPGLLISGMFSSNLITESGFAFVFCPFFLHFYLTKNKKYALISFVFVLLTFKRIAILGVVFALVLFIFFRPFLNSAIKNRNVSALLLATGNYLVISLYTMLITGKFDEFIVQNFKRSPDSLFMGRYGMYQFMFEKLEGLSIFGKGLGITAFILDKSNHKIATLHSDILKNYIEFGPIIFFIWIFIFYRLSTVNVKLLIMAIFLNVLFLTDNVFIYFEVMFVFYFFHIIYLNELNPSRKLANNL